jgi:hypothetical protein
MAVAIGASGWIGLHGTGAIIVDVPALSAVGRVEDRA